MSRKQQERYLKTALDLMQGAATKDAGKKGTTSRVDYHRSKKANIVSHNFSVSSVQIKKGLKTRLSKEPDRGYGLRGKELEIFLSGINIDEKIRKALKAIRDNIVAARKNPATMQKVNITNFFFNGSAVKAKFVGIEGVTTNIYEQVKEVFKDVMETLALEVSSSAMSVVEKKGISRDQINKGEDFGSKGYWELSHAEEEGILESYIRAGINDAIDDINKGEEKPLTPLEIAKALNALEIPEDPSLKIQRIIRETGDDEMNVFLGDFQENKDEMGVVKRNKNARIARIKELQDQLNKNPGKIIDMPGSDSFRQIKRKKTIKKVIEPFIKIPGIEVKTEDIKVKPSNTTVENRKTNRRKARVKKVKSPLQKVKQTPLGNVKKQSNSPTRLAALINAKLPQTVAKNMGPPRLENRTGRFASSTRVVDVQQTPQGFPSIGYTYEKNPYSVFERTSGTRFASAERDPRDLIQLSIREIAQQLTIGRFFTRRV